METDIPHTLRHQVLALAESAGRSARFPALAAAGSVLLALLCSLLIYPGVAGSISNKVTTDRYDELGLGIVHNGTLSFFPDPQPTVLRAPLYPVMLAAIFSLGDRSLPFSVQILQAFLHGLTCLLVFHIARNLSGPRRAPFAAVLFAIHPYLLWYTGRMVIETTSVFLFTLIVYCVLHFASRPSLTRAVAVGLSIGAGVLCKSTYLPFVVAIPLLLSLSHPRRYVHAAATLAAALALIAPWVVRNHQVCGQWGVVQTLTGYNFYVGDRFVERYSGSPLGYAKIIAETDFSKMDEGLPEDVANSSSARREVLQDQWLLSRSIEHYVEDPAFLFKKIAANAVMFWTLGSTPPVSIFTMALQVPLLLLFVIAAVRCMRRQGPWSAESIPIWLIAIYFAIHLPVYALARFSVVFIPTMLSYLFVHGSRHDAAARQD